MGVAVVYFVAGEIGLGLAVPPGYATAIWPPSGIALASVLLLGYRVWPGILLGSFLVNLSNSATPGAFQLTSALIPLAIGMGACVQAITGGYWVKKYAEYPNDLTSDRTIYMFFLFGGLCSALINATWSVSFLVLIEKIPSSNIITNWLTWWMGDVFGILIFTPLILVWDQSQAWKTRRYSITLTTLAAFGITTAVVYFEVQHENQRMKAEFEEHAKELKAALENSFSTHLNVLHALSSFYLASTSVERQEFHDYVRDSLSSYQGIQAFEWSPIVASKDRAAFETLIKQEGFQNFQITERNQANQLARASERAYYTPVTFIEPYLGNEMALGYDLSSHPLRKAAIDRARDTGELCITPPITLVQEKGNQAGLLAFIPLYRKGVDIQSVEDRRENILGFVLAVFRGGDIVTASLLNLDRHGLWYRLIDQSAGENQMIYASEQNEPEPLILQHQGVFGSEFSLMYTSPLEVGGHRWRFDVVPKQEYFVMHHPHDAYLILTTGLILTSLVTAYVMLSSGRRQLLEKLVYERTEVLALRTEALAKSELNYRLESEKNLAFLHNASDGIHILDLDGYVVEASDSFCRMLGYSRHEVVGMHVSQWDAKFTPEELPKMAQLPLTKNARVQFETLHRRKGGSVFEVEISGFPLQQNGTPVLFFSSRDITERKKIEADLRIAAVAFESQEGILITDAKTNIMRVNSAFTAITGYTLAEVLGKNPRILSSGKHDDDFYARMWAHINAQGFWEGEIWNRRKNGEIYPEHLSVNSVRDPQGAITNYVATLTDITVSKAASEKIERLAYFDPLTGLANRRLLLDRLQKALADSLRNQTEGALLFLDLDNFKTLNDTLGHEYGDLLLQQVATRLNECVREADTVARLGGDEFVVMLENLSPAENMAASQADMVATKILESLNQTYRLKSHDYRNTPSIGVTLFNQASYNQPLDDLLKQADIAMYQAKKANRNTIRFFDPAMQKSIENRVAMEIALVQAIIDNEFQLYYQIQIDQDNKPYGAEALIRWLHPERGLIPPMEFIPLAEETGHITAIGTWVFNTACAQLKNWEASVLTKDLTLSINVSAKQFRQGSFVTEIENALRDYAINPSQLKLELTESMLLEKIDDAIAIMNRLKNLGVQISLDDFGTGYSSLQYLKKLPLTQLKIDQSFVRDIPFDVSDSAIAKTIIAMAKSLELDIIAEGVETQEQYQILLDSGCTHFQGYLFGKPIPIEAFSSSIENRIRTTLDS